MIEPKFRLLKYMKLLLTSAYSSKMWIPNFLPATYSFTSMPAAFTELLS